MPSGKETLSNKVYNDIKEKILRLEMRPGERVSEEFISQQMGISRTPVREALQRLNNDGLITLYPKRHAEITYYDDDMIRQIGTIRLSQDILAAQLAMYYGSDADFDALVKISEECEESGRQGDVYKRIQLDTDFHLKITEISRNSLLMKHQREVYMQLHLIQIIKYKKEVSMRLSAHHKTMVDMMRKKDEEAIICKICEHLTDFHRLDTHIVNKYSRMLREKDFLDENNAHTVTTMS